MGRRRVTASVVVVALLVAVAAWWLLRTPGAGRGDADVLQTRPALERELALSADPADGTLAPPAAGALTLAPAAQRSSEPPPAPALVITGRILDPLGRPLPGAGVLLVADRNDAWTKHWTFVRQGPEAVPTHVRSGADGRFVLGADELPAGGTPRLVVHHDSAATLVRPCSGLRAGRLDVGDLQLEPGASVRGRVLDAARAPLADVDVTFSDLPGGADPRDEDETRLVFCARRTLADGRFLATGLRCVPTALRAELRTPQVWLRPAVLRDLPLAAGAPLDVGDLVLEEGGVIAGSVRDDTGALVAGANVSASRRGDWQTFDEADGLWRTQARSDAQGVFRLTGLQPGLYDLDCSARGLAWAYADEVPLGTPDVQLVMPRCGSLLVRLRDEFGAPLEGAELKATLPRKHKTRPWSDAQFEVASGAAAGLAPGAYRIRGAGPLETEIDVRAAGHVPQVVLAPGVGPGQEHELVVTLRLAVALSGRVVDDAGAPVAGASVSLARAAPSLALSGRSDDVGAFVLDGLEAGSWRLRATADGHGRAEALLDLPEGRAPEPLEITLERLGSVEGLVTRGRVPLAGARVHAVALRGGAPDAGALQDALRSDDPHEPRRLRVVDADAHGRFRLSDVPAGPLLLWVERGADARWALAFCLHDPADASLFRVRVEPGAATEALLDLPAPAALRGRVLGGGEALAGAPVVLAPAKLHAGSEWPFGALEAATDGSGQFAFADVPPGDWVVVAQPPGGLVPLAQSLELLPGDLRSVELAAQGRTLEAVVTDAASGAPLEGAELRFVLDLEPEAGEVLRLWPDALGAAVSLSESMWWSVTTGADGRIAVRWLPTGRYRLMTSRPGYLDDDRFVAIAPSLELRPEPIGLVRGASVSGEIAGGGLAPLQYAVSCGPPDQPRRHWAEVDGARFSCDGLEPGDWVLAVYAQPDLERALGTRTVRLAAGQHLDVVLRLDG